MPTIEMVAENGAVRNRRRGNHGSKVCGKIEIEYCPAIEPPVMQMPGRIHSRHDIQRQAQRTALSVKITPKTV